MLPRLSFLKRAALDFFFPQKCLGCGEEGDLICISCQQKLPRIVQPFCPVCGRPQINGILCSICASKTNSLNGVRAVFKFDTVIRQAVHDFKYRGVKTLCKPLGKLMSDYFNRTDIPGRVLVPVPLHPKRLKERGYNQSELLANEISKWVNLPVVTNSLIRSLFRLPQAKTSSIEERLENVRGAFACNNTTLKGQDVLLIDDVTTTGATLEACSVALKDAGASMVWALVLAREI